MLNADYRNQVIRDLERIDKEYTKEFRQAVTNMERLQSSREIAVRTIQNVEGYVTVLANRPRNIDTTISEIKSHYVKFLDVKKEIVEIDNQQRDRQVSSEGFGVAGALGGVGVAALGPTAAMSVAMTFGTASTGTAIASLSGAAATNAALAWLGGGTLAAGGAGMAGGQALLTLAGPVGWIIGGVSLAGCLLAINYSNKEMAEKVESSIATIKKEIERIKEIDVQVRTWNDETKKASNEISRCLNRLKTKRKRDYNTLTDDEVNELISLLNTTEVLSKKLRQTISGRG